jgi:hypothetical protein
MGRGRSGAGRVVYNRSDYLDFRSAGAAATFMNENYSAQTSDLSPVESYGISRWTGMDYEQTNRELRQGQLISQSSRVSAYRLDGVFGRSSSVTDHDLTVYRSFGDYNLSDLRVGMTITDNGFTATTVGRGGRHNATILVPKKTRAVWVARLSGLSEENELLLDRGTTFRVLRAGKNPLLAVVGQRERA